jgi:hypothetical protein
MSSQGIAACGECAPMLWAQGKTNAAVRLERLWDDVAKQYELDILCAYPASNFPREKDERAFNTICAELGCSFPLNNLPSANPTRVVWA